MKSFNSQPVKPWSAALLALVVSASGCKKKDSGDDLTCGEGTTQEGGKCVVDDSGGMGGAGDGDGDNGTVDERLEGVPAERRGDARIVLDEFEGARAAAPASSTGAVVVWDPVSIVDVEYHIYVSTSDDNFSFGKPQFRAPAGANSALLSGLEKNTEHFIVVRAVIAGVELSGPDEPVSVETADDTSAPSFLGVESTETVEGGKVKLTWEPVDDDQTPSSVMTYLVFIGTDEGDVDLITPYAVSAPGATDIDVQMPAPETEYFFIVRARDAAGNVDDNEEELSGTSGEDVEPPRFSGCDSAVVRNASSFTVTWTPAVDDIADASEISYNLYASTEPDGHNFSQPNDSIVGGNKGIVTGLLAGEQYYIVCRAEDPSGNEEENTRVQFDTTKSDDVPPVFSGISSYENVTAESVDLIWAAASDNQAIPDDIVYRVFVADTIDGHDFEAEAHAESTPGATSMTVQDLPSDQDVFLVVLAVDDALNQSEPASATVVTTLVSFRNDIEIPIFATRCASSGSGCHEGSSPQGQMSLSPGVAYGQIVNVSTISAGGAEIRVTPGSAATSHLYLRLTGDRVPQMPASLDVVTEDEKATIARWINQGAFNN